MSDPNGEARKLLDDADDMHRCTPAERVARAQVFAILAQAEASQAMVELLSRIANALERAHPDSATVPAPGYLVWPRARGRHRRRPYLVACRKPVEHDW
jgi:hypothetical protein